MEFLRIVPEIAPGFILNFLLSFSDLSRARALLSTHSLIDSSRDFLIDFYQVSFTDFSRDSFVDFSIFFPGSSSWIPPEVPSLVSPGTPFRCRSSRSIVEITAISSFNFPGFPLGIYIGNP